MPQASPIAADESDRINAGVGGVAGIDAQSDEIGREVIHRAFDLILEFDMSAGMSVKRRSNAIFVTRDLRDLGDTVHHRLPRLTIETMGRAGPSRRRAALAGDAVNDDESRRLESAKDCAGAPGLLDDCWKGGRISERIEKTAGRQAQPARGEFVRQALRIGRKIADWSEIDSGESCGRDIIEHAPPGRVLRAVGEVDTP